MKFFNRINYSLFISLLLTLFTRLLLYKMDLNHRKYKITPASYAYILISISAFTSIVQIC